MTARKTTKTTKTADKATEAPAVYVNPYEVVRASDPDTGDHVTVTRTLAATLGYRVLEGHPATDQYGRWLPRKPHTPKGAGTTTEQGDTPADNPKE